MVRSQRPSFDLGMTAEIAIMNAQAVALAADSAVTFGSKVKNTANKIFALSKFEPIAVMVYNNADFFQLPWETIIKSYRSQLGERHFGSVKLYAEDFISYLESDSSIKSATHDPTRIEEVIEGEFIGIREKALERAQAEISTSGGVSPELLAKLVATVVTEYRIELKENEPAVAARRTISIDTSIVEAILPRVFGELPLEQITRSHLIETGQYIVRAFPVAPHSGVVVAGFGREQMFPALHSYEVFTFADEAVVAVPDDRSVEISVNDPAYVVPFAQSEVVATFMDGVDPRYQQLIDGLIANVLKEYPSEILAQVPTLSPADRDAIAARFRSGADKVAADYLRRLEQVRVRVFSGPITSVVQSLPKDELAAMAEALVNLTSFKRKISMDPETVGGPIDVAVISKGDGLIWIKRKHYFEPKLNPQFFNLYYWRERHGNREELNEEG